MARAATTSDVFNAIAEPCRRDLLAALRTGGEVPVADLVARMRLPQPQVSKHLGVLRQVDLVRCRSVGRQRLYRLNAPALQPVHAWVSEFEAMWNARLDRLDDYVAHLAASTSAHAAGTTTGTATGTTTPTHPRPDTRRSSR